jgi:outer membrane protein OmpA-like peptidoglycan-associated protein
VSARALIALALLSGCAGSRLKVRSDAVAEVIESARKNGARKCAPVQLAMAESHHVFAGQELREGNYFQAREELEVAEHNASEALRLSPRGQCVKIEKVAVTDADADGDGVPNSMDDCPMRPEDRDGYADADGCPDPDNDEDGLSDKVDDCPNKPEDKDGFADADGCPDVDNDQDGLSDRVDECPDQAEDDDGVDDDDGCPDCDNDGDGVPECPEAIDQCPDQPANTADGCPQKYKNVVVTKTKIELRQTVFFDTNKTTIKRESFDLLDEVAQALKDNPSIHVRIEGHTDSRGSDRRNLRLSQGRAGSVRDYLIRRGISPDRMVSEGYGERVPLADNRTKAGREQNRRVEFVITQR